MIFLISLRDVIYIKKKKKKCPQKWQKSFSYSPEYYAIIKHLTVFVWIKKYYARLKTKEDKKKLESNHKKSHFDEEDANTIWFRLKFELLENCKAFYLEFLSDWKSKQWIFLSENDVKLELLMQFHQQN